MIFTVFFKLAENNYETRILSSNHLCNKNFVKKFRWYNGARDLLACFKEKRSMEVSIDAMVVGVNKHTSGKVISRALGQELNFVLVETFHRLIYLFLSFLDT